jgi:hypothetical protein
LDSKNKRIKKGKLIQAKTLRQKWKKVATKQQTLEINIKRPVDKKRYFILVYKYFLQLTIAGFEKA